VENTEFENAGVSYKGVSYKMSGSEEDWCFKEFRIPSFGIEILPSNDDPGEGGGKHNNLVHWMKTTLPVFMYLLVNIDNLRQWKKPDILPPLSEGASSELL
jgi:hypothetical protein